MATIVAHNRASRKAYSCEKRKLARITQGDIIKVARKSVAAAKANLSKEIIEKANSLLLYDIVSERSQVELH